MRRNGCLLSMAALVVVALATTSVFGSEMQEQKPGAVPAIDDGALLKLFEVGDLRLPPRLFTPEMVERLRQGKPTILATGYVSLFRNADLGKRLAEQIPEERWREMIPPYAAFTVRCGSNQNISDSGACPFCGRTYGGTVMTLEEFLQNPFRAKTGCCGQAVYEREADMPADYKARPNHTEKIPHLDGKSFDYRFYVPPGMENAGPEIGSNRRHWFCSASEVWWARERLFHTENQDSALIALATEVFQRENPKAARALAVIYDRLAEVYPGYPLTDNGGIAHGLARGADGKHYLTREEYRATEVPRRWLKPDWFKMPPYYNLGKMNHASGWQDGVMLNLGDMAAVFDLIRDRPETRAFSKEKYGSETAWEEKVRKGVLDELHFQGQWLVSTGGNTVLGWIMGAIKLSLVTQDPFFLQTAIDMIGPIIDNHYFSDGMSTEGAYNYGGMMRPIIGVLGSLRDCLGIDVRDRHPQLPTIEQRSDSPITTLYGVESMHSDEHAYFFSGNGTGWKHPPQKPDYTQHEAAQCLPEYGLVCLRAGAPGSRMETIMDFQTAVAHTHSARLNVQSFYEGVNLMPDIGYACGAVDVTRPPWSQVQYPFEKLPLPPGTDYWGAWYYGYTGIPEAHSTALVDGEYASANPKGGPLTFRRFLGGMQFGEPGYDAQFVDVEAQGLFNLREQPVDVFKRQLVVITLANGRPLTLDFFRIRGGQRHDLLWHAPATGPEDKLDTNLGMPTPVDGSLNDVLNRANDKRIGKSEPGRGASLFQRLGRWNMPDGTWQATFHVQPSRFNPVTEGGKKLYEPWVQALHDVNLRLWSAAVGSAAETREVLCGRMPWPSKIREVVDGKEITGVVSLKDAFHFLVESRTSKAPGLTTTFVHALEPYNPDQSPTVRKVEVGGSDKSDESDKSDNQDRAMGAGVRITLGAGGQVLAASTANGGSFVGGGMKLEGRLGVLQPVNGSLTLFDGTRFEAGGFAVALDPSWRMKLLGVIGDLTGHPRESALIVQSSRPLPMDKTVVGRMLTVNHRISPWHSSGYVIERVSPFGTGRYRIDLRDCPSFIVHRFRVRDTNPTDPRLLTVNYWMLKGDGASEKCFYTGRRARFPKLRFETGMTIGPGGMSHWHHNVIRLDEPPPAPVKANDPLIVYQIQPGDEVTVPSHFACIGAETAKGLKLSVTSTGPAVLTVPGDYRKAFRLTDVTQRPLSRVRSGPRGLRIELGQEDLADGRARVVLTR